MVRYFLMPFGSEIGSLTPSDGPPPTIPLFAVHFRHVAFGSCNSFTRLRNNPKRFQKQLSITSSEDGSKVTAIYEGNKVTGKNLVVIKAKKRNCYCHRRKEGL